MPSDEATTLTQSILELLTREDLDDNKKHDVIAQRIDRFAQNRREGIVRECSKMAQRMADQAKGAASRHHGTDIAKSIMELTVPRDETITKVTDTVERVFADMMSGSEDGITPDFARAMSKRLGEEGLRVQWVTRVGQFGIRVKANNVQVEFEAGPTPQPE